MCVEIGLQLQKGTQLTTHSKEISLEFQTNILQFIRNGFQYRLAYFAAEPLLLRAKLGTVGPRSACTVGGSFHFSIFFRSAEFQLSLQLRVLQDKITQTKWRACVSLKTSWRRETARQGKGRAKGRGR